ncbi:glycosyltransferase family 4 protein [Candidatus Parcubacteria bacterium]|nr:glycosyltransferase family 4 protein [Candidatus Parcubacteria bacterium]
MKRILIFSVAYHPFVAGAEVAVKEITDRLSHKASAGAVELEFDMITLNLDGKQKSEEKIGNVMVYRIGGKGRIHKLLFPFTAYFKASKLHKKLTYDAIWSIMASFSGFAAVFFKMSNPKVFFILTLQEGDPISYIKRQVWFVYPLFRRIFWKADLVQAISNYLADFARSMGTQARVEVIPNGVDLKIFLMKNDHIEVKSIRQELGIQPDDKVLITTSRLEVKNGVRDIIESLKFLPTNVKLIIVGIGTLERKLKAQVKTLGIQDRVVFLGFKNNSDLPKYLHAADVFIRPSLSEGMGISFIEAMAAGVPVVATPVGGIPDFLKDWQTGLFCAVDDPESIADRVNIFLKDSKARTEIVRIAHTLVTQKYDWSRIADEMRNKVFSKI